MNRNKFGTMVATIVSISLLATSTPVTSAETAVFHQIRNAEVI
ncbi:MAG: hypothetical protein Q4A82_06345 [Corynebacterium sp.]|nr:hypothetical protein [Corynebacterium sp.]